MNRTVFFILIGAASVALGACNRTSTPPTPKTDVLIPAPMRDAGQSALPLAARPVNPSSPAAAQDLK